MAEAVTAEKAVPVRKCEHDKTYLITDCNRERKDYLCPM